MNLKTICCILLGISTMFFSCKDSDPEEEIILPVSRIKTITYYENVSIVNFETFEYDSLGRISKKTFGSDTLSKATFDKYRYSGDKVIVERYANHTNHYDTDTLHLNAKGLLMWRRNSYYNNEYDSKGFLINSKTVKNVTTPEIITYQVSNGNTMKMKLDQGTKEKTITTTTHSYTFLPNSVNTIGNENKGMSFLGRQDKNLVEEVHTVVISMYYSEDRYTYAYEYDAQNRVTKRTAVGGIFKPSETYTYY